LWKHSSFQRVGGDITGAWRQMQQPTVDFAANGKLFIGFGITPP
jgi:hypothetical protein